jgi:hypothetical protein
MAADSSVIATREELDALGQSPVLFDALIVEEDKACVFVKTVDLDDPGIREQRVTPNWPHHLPGELIIALTGQAACIALQRQGITDASWRGHGVRIRDARFSAPVLIGERVYVRAETLRVRRIRDSMHARFRFRMWKIDDDGREVETYRSEQDAIFFPGGA